MEVHQLRHELVHVQHSSHAGFTLTHLYGDDHHQTCLHQNSEGLIVGDVLAVVPDRVLHGGPGDEEEDEGAVGAVHQTAQEGFLAEVHVQLAWSVKLRILETPAVVHVLRRQPNQHRFVLHHPTSGAGVYFCWFSLPDQKCSD